MVRITFFRFINHRPLRPGPSPISRRWKSPGYRPWRSPAPAEPGATGRHHILLRQRPAVPECDANVRLARVEQLLVVAGLDDIAVRIIEVKRLRRPPLGPEVMVRARWCPRALPEDAHPA